jgi:hypothetical protein
MRLDLDQDPRVIVRVDCSPDPRGEEEPRPFFIGDRGAEKRDRLLFRGFSWSSALASRGFQAHGGGEPVEQGGVVAVLVEDRGATVAAIQHMVDVSGHLSARNPRPGTRTVRAMGVGT